jgi:hypothetical protein
MLYWPSAFPVKPTTNGVMEADRGLSPVGQLVSNLRMILI